MNEPRWRHKHDDGYPEDGELVEVLYNEPGQPGPVLRRARWNDPALMMWTREPEGDQADPFEWYHPEHVDEWRPVEDVAPIETVSVRFPTVTLAALTAVGLNPFAVQLLAESHLRTRQRLVDAGRDPGPHFGFELPVVREDCAAFAGVRVYIEYVQDETAPGVAGDDA